MIQIIDKYGNTSTDFANVIVIDKYGVVKKTGGGGGGTPTGPAGGDLSGTYPNPTVTWSNGSSTYNLLYYPLSTNPAGYLTSAALSPYLTSATAALTYYPIPTGTTSQYLRGDGTLATFPTIPSVTPAALTKTDDTNVTLTLGGTPATSLLQAVSLTLGWTGTLADARIASASTWNAKAKLTQLGSQTLAFASWSLVGGFYTYTFSNVNITSTSVVDFTPNNASINEVSSCRMLPQVDVASGSCTFYATFPPQSNIVGLINIWQ